MNTVWKRYGIFGMLSVLLIVFESGMVFLNSFTRKIEVQRLVFYKDRNGSF